MSASAFFITGTDTDVGKTWVAAALLTAARKQGLSTAAIKPVAAGCSATSQGLRNDDALILQEAMTLDLPYQQVNPVALPSAIAPHIAAQQVDGLLDVARLEPACRAILSKPVDICFVEGAGGWRVPLNGEENLSHLVKQLNLPVVLVVGMRLGCLNHALLTADAIQSDGLRLAAWVANTIDPDMPVARENFQTLVDRIPAPCLGNIPSLKPGNWLQAADYLDLSTLLTSQ